MMISHFEFTISVPKHPISPRIKIDFQEFDWTNIALYIFLSPEFLKTIFYSGRYFYRENISYLRFWMHELSKKVIWLFQFNYLMWRKSWIGFDDQVILASNVYYHLLVEFQQKFRRTQAGGALLLDPNFFPPSECWANWRYEMAKLRWTSDLQKRSSNFGYTP